MTNIEPPNIQLYDLLRHELHMSDGKSLEFMHVLNKEYKSGVKEDLARFEERFDRWEKKLDARFEKVDARFDKIDARFEKVDERFDKMDERFDAQDKRLDQLNNKIDLTASNLRGELRVEIRDTKVATIQWMVSIFFALAMMIIGLYFKK